VVIRKRFVTLATAAAVAAAAAVAFSLATPLTAQAPPAAQASTPTPPLAGQPDLQGVWRVWNLAQYDLEDHSAKPGVPAGRGFVVDPPDGKIPYLPAALAKRQQNYEGTKTTDPVKNTDPFAKCYLPGIPRMTYIGFPFQIVQTPQYVGFYYEWGHHRRYAQLGNVPVPSPDEVFNWLGVSRARFEGNSLIVNVTNFNDATWFDMAGNYHSDQLKVVEKYTPINADTLQYEATIEDPKTFSRPWTIRMTAQRQKEIGILDYECTFMLDLMGVHHTWPREF
jgi:hypothetical protein